MLRSHWSVLQYKINELCRKGCIRRSAAAARRRAGGPKSLPHNDSTTALHLFVCFRCFNSNKASCEIRAVLRIQEQNSTSRARATWREQRARSKINRGAEARPARLTRLDSTPFTCFFAKRFFFLLRLAGWHSYIMSTRSTCKL